MAQLPRKGMVMFMNDCIFCKIIAGEIPSQLVYEDEHVFAFNDITPQAPMHILIIPKEHAVSSVADLDEDSTVMAARCLVAITKIAKYEGLTNGYRVITNSGPDAGQTVDHLHFHLLGGKPLGPLVAG